MHLSRSQTKLLLLCFASLLAAAAVTLGRADGAQATNVATLYAVTGAGGATGCGGTQSRLYTIDPSTAAATLVADITIGGNSVNHVTGLAVDPTTGTLYGFMNGQQANCSDWGQSTLITIDKATGVATVVGSVGLANFQSPDMSFDPFGHLYAWSEGDNDATRGSQDDLMLVDKSAGTATKVGECGCGTSNTGLAFDSAGDLYLKSWTWLQRLNQFTGHLFGSGHTLSTGADNMLAFGPGDVLYTGQRGSSPAFSLYTVDPETGGTTLVGTNSIAKISALAWDMGTPAPPDVADLSLTKDVDVSSPEDWGDAVTYTITVTNDGPVDATGVEVTDVLPAGVTYVSDDGSGAYDSGTGIWAVGSLTNGNSATLHITGSVQPTGSYENDAEVIASDQYDSDSVPGSGEGDTFASSTLTPTPNPNVDVAGSIVAKGKLAAKSKKAKFDVVVSNVGSVPVTVSTTDLDVQVNGSTNTVFCGKPKASTIKPAKQKKYSCSFSPFLMGITPGQSVTYQATINLPADGFPGNDTDSATVIAL